MMRLRVWIKLQLTPAHLTLLWLQGCGNCGACITSETGGGGEMLSNVPNYIVQRPDLGYLVHQNKTQQ